MGFYFMNEVWKDIPNYEGYYQVSNLGNVKSLNRYIYDKNNNLKLIKGVKIKKVIGTYGYHKISLHKNSKRANGKIHQLVAMAFLNHVPCGQKLVVNHINFIKTDNRVENLEIVTTRYNSNYRKNKGTSKYNGVHYNSKDKKWKSLIYINNKQEYLGSFNTEIEASFAHDKRFNEYLITNK